MDKAILTPETETKIEETTQKENVEVKKEKLVLHKKNIQNQIKVEGDFSSSTSVFVEEEKTKELDDGLEEIDLTQPTVSSYVASLENVTIADFKKEQRERERAKAEEEARRQAEEENLREQQRQQEIEEVVETEIKAVEEEPVKRTLIIEKPNYDFMSKAKRQPKRQGKFRLLVVALATLVLGIGCTTGAVVIDNMSQSYIELQDKYELKLWKYIKKIESLNATDKGLDFIETYPEEINDVSSIGEKSNWFNEIVDYVADHT